MTSQEFYDKTIVHLAQQGRPAKDYVSPYVSPAPMCYYRRATTDGTVLKCAAGIHIPDDLYLPEFEGKRISRVIARYSSLELRRFFPNEPLAEALQQLHDSPPNWDSGGFNARGFAMAYHVALRYGLAPMTRERAEASR